MDITYHNLWQRIALAILGILEGTLSFGRDLTGRFYCGSGNQPDLLNSVVFFFFFFRLLTTTSMQEWARRRLFQHGASLDEADDPMSLVSADPISIQSWRLTHRSRESITKHATSTHIIRPVDRLHWIHTTPALLRRLTTPTLKFLGTYLIKVLR